MIVISTMATNGAEFMSNYGRSVLIPIYEIMNEREADLLIGNGKRIYETQVTKSRNAPLLIEVARRSYKGGSVNLRLRTR